MQDALSRAERLLRAYDHPYEANLVAIAGAQYRVDPRAACRTINDPEWWEGSHSVAAVDLAVSGGFTQQARADAQALRAALIEIFTTMRAYGEHNAAGELVVTQMHKWLESHV